MSSPEADLLKGLANEVNRLHNDLTEERIAHAQTTEWLRLSLVLLADDIPAPLMAAGLIKEGD